MIWSIVVLSMAINSIVAQQADWFRLTGLNPICGSTDTCNFNESCCEWFNRSRVEQKTACYGRLHGTIKCCYLRINPTDVQTFFCPLETECSNSTLGQCNPMSPEENEHVIDHLIRAFNDMVAYFNWLQINNRTPHYLNEYIAWLKWYHEQKALAEASCGPAAGEDIDGISDFLHSNGAMTTEFQNNSNNQWRRLTGLEPICGERDKCNCFQSCCELLHPPGSKRRNSTCYDEPHGTVQCCYMRVNGSYTKVVETFICPLDTECSNSTVGQCDSLSPDEINRTEQHLAKAQANILAYLNWLLVKNSQDESLKGYITWLKIHHAQEVIAEASCATEEQEIVAGAIGKKAEIGAGAIGNQASDVSQFWFNLTGQEPVCPTNRQCTYSQTCCEVFSEARENRYVMCFDKPHGTIKCCYFRANNTMDVQTFACDLTAECSSTEANRCDPLPVEERNLAKESIENALDYWSFYANWSQKTFQPRQDLVTYIDWLKMNHEAEQEQENGGHAQQDVLAAIGGKTKKEKGQQSKNKTDSAWRPKDKKKKQQARKNAKKWCASKHSKH